MLHEYHVIYSVWYYPRFHTTAVDLATYYPWIRGRTFILFGVEVISQSSGRRLRLFLRNAAKRRG
jgi:hypothetical protein